MQRWALYLLLCLSLCVGGPVVAAPRIGLLLIFNSNQKSSLQLHRGLVELLKQKRAEGHFAGTGISTNFFAYNAAEPDHAASLKKMGVGKVDKPMISLTELDAEGRVPTKLTWRSPYESSEQALELVNKQLGLAPIQGTSAGLFTPPGYGFSVEMPYPITKTCPTEGGNAWMGGLQGEGLLLLGVSNITIMAQDRPLILDSAVNALLQEMTIKEISRKEIQHNGMEGVEVSGMYQIYLAQVRVLASQDRLYQMLAINYRNDESVLQKFFQSFQLLK